MLTHALATAPLCTDPQRDAWLQTLVEQSATFLLDQVGKDQLEAIILTGSTARGEASILPTEMGYRLLGDLEFLVIYRAPFDFPKARRHMSALSAHATREVGGKHGATIEFGPAGLVYLRRNIQPSIFAYDLLNHGRVIWPQANILTVMRPFGVETIPREDALNLLMNRLLEMLVLKATPYHTEPDAAQNRAYHVVKVMLDLAGSALAFAGRYVSLYSERSRHFADLLATSPDLRAALPDSDDFQTALAYAIDCKLDPSEADLDALVLERAWHQCTAWGRSLWLWEARRLLDIPATTFINTLEAYLQRESLEVRLKGWGKFLRHPLRPAGALSWPHLLRHVFHTSPQTLTYAAALLTQAGMAGAAGPDWRQRLAGIAPIPLTTTHSAHTVQEIGALWQWLIRNN